MFGDYFMKKNNYRLLAKNMGILTIGNFGSKILSYFLVPVYTMYLTTSEYGIYDLLQSTINLIIPILTINMSAAILRFSLDRNADLKSIFTIAIKIALLGFLLVLLIILLNLKMNIVPSFKEFSIYFILLYILNMFVQLLTAFSKGTGDLYGMTISSIIFSFSLFIFTLVFLSFFSMGLNGYFLSNILSNFIAVCYLSIRLKVWRYVVFRQKSTHLQLEMIKYSGPLIFTTIGWWINNISDRYIVTALCGLAENGIYSVAYKLPTILSVFQSIFNQAWQLSTVDEYDKHDTNGFFKDVYIMYNIFMVVLCSVIISICKLLSVFLFSKDFYDAWVYVPFLLISVVFGSLIGVIDGIYQAVKDSKIQSVSVLVGALFNIIFNVIFIKMIGTIGAAFSTMMAYFITWIISWVNLRKYMKLRVNIAKQLFSYFLLFIQSILLLFVSDNFIMIISQIILILTIIALYYNDVKTILFRNKKKS